MRTLTEEEMAKMAYQMVELIKSSFDKGIRESVRTRCRQLYSSLYYSGVLSTLAFTYAKAESEDLVKKICEWIDASLKGERIRPPVEEKEKLSYAVYTAFFCRLFRAIGIENKGELGKIIHVLTSEKSPYLIEDTALRFARWLKRFAEALLKGE